MEENQTISTPEPQSSSDASTSRGWFKESGADNLFFILITALIIIAFGVKTGDWAGAIIVGAIFGAIVWLLFKTPVGEKIVNFTMMFLAWCGGVPRSDIKKMSGKDQLMYARTGATLFIPTTLAYVCACFVAMDVFGASARSAMMTGFVWAVIIFTIDAALISTMKREPDMKFGRSSLIIRFILAFALGVLISSVAELRIFQKEIRQEFAEELDEAKHSIDSSERAEMTALSYKVNAERAKVDQKYNDFMREVDNNIGSRGAGYGPVAKKKEKLWQDAKSDYEANIAPVLGSEKQAIEEKYAKKRGKLEDVFSDGIASRLEYLHRAGIKHPIIGLAHLFVFLFLIAIELVPVLAKMMARPTQYEYDLAAATAEWEQKVHAQQTVLATARIEDEKRIATEQAQIDQLKQESATTLESNRIAAILKDCEAIDASAKRMDRDMDKSFTFVEDRIIHGGDEGGSFFGRIFGRKPVEPVG